MTTVSIIGKGNMGTAIAAVAERGGHRVQTLGRDDADVAVTGDIVVLAVPYSAVADLAVVRRESLVGKVVVDISNPVDFETFDSLVVPSDSSATAVIASLLPHSHVLKAFNTTFAGTLADGSLGAATTTVLIAGDDDESKGFVAEMIQSGGLLAVDAGSLSRARELEALGFLQMTLAANEKITWSGGFALTA